MGPLPAQLALSRLRQVRRVGYLTDAFADDRMPPAVIAALRAGAVLRTAEDGEIRFLGTQRLAELVIPEHAEIRRLSAEQSNTSLIYGECAVLKVIRRISPGIHPEAEMTRHLTQAGFASAPALLGEVVRVAPDGTPHLLMIVQAFVRNQGDAWSWTMDWLARAVDEAALTQASRTQAASAEDEPFAGYLAFASALGRRLAELHAVLARPSDDPDFAPERATSADRDAWAAGALAQIGPALDLLAGRELTEADAAAAKRMLDRRQALETVVHALAQSADGALKTRVHGDFHLGQVLVAQGDAVIVDFEGEPARPLHERRAKGSALRDVAGLLRSLDYAAAVAVANPALASATATSGEIRAALLRRWQRQAEAAFLAAYREVARAAPHPWMPPAGEVALLDLFLLEKAAYEVRYEAANRPGWIGVPLRGLSALADRVLA